MEAVSRQVQKLEVHYQESQRHADNAKAAEAWVQQALGRIYGWQKAATEAHPGAFLVANPEQFKDYDQLPFDLKRVAVEASGVELLLYPVGWLQKHEGAPEYAGRVLTRFRHAAIDNTDQFNF
jgi:hypothetical protein